MDPLTITIILLIAGAFIGFLFTMSASATTRIIVIIVMALVFAGVGRGIMGMTQPPQITEAQLRAEIDRTLETAPPHLQQIFEYIQENDPATYDALIARTVALVNAGGSPDEIANEIRIFMAERVYARLDLLSDEELIAVTQYSQDEIAIFDDLGRNDLCIGIMRGEGIGTVTNMPDSLYEAEFEMMKVMYESERQGGPLADDTLFITTIQNAMTTVVTTYGPDAFSFLEGPGTKSARDNACGSIHLFFDGFLVDTPFPDNAHVLRRLYAQ